MTGDKRFPRRRPRRRWQALRINAEADIPSRCAEVRGCVESKIFQTVLEDCALLSKSKRERDAASRAGQWTPIGTVFVQIAATLRAIQIL